MSLRRILTLREANELLGREMPGPGAAHSALVTFHRRAARVYQDVALVDRHHYHEAMSWAGIEAQKADEAEEQLRRAKLGESERLAKREAAPAAAEGSAVEVSE
ncbi:MAG TPA: AMED_5909 family protein [Actinokineospora sp.]|jgi:hypothetical protein|nr:AMED_5909 family protein [Actinokineospora sp.]